MGDIRRTTGTLVMGKDWDSWVADYDGSAANVYPGCAAKQYQDGNRQDVSVVYDDQWPHRKADLSPGPVIHTDIKWPAKSVLTFGTRGPRVEALQTALRHSGIRGVRGIDNDGIFGDQTRTAVRNFEAAQNLGIDQGVAGQEVRDALIRLGLMNSNGNPRG
jgi:hypothetical protein